MNQAEIAARFAGLHVRGAPLLLYNAWDAGSAKAIRPIYFLPRAATRAQSLGETLERTRACAAAGASGFFIPRLRDDALIGRVCNGVALPVNVMVMDGVPSNDQLTELGVSRINYGPIPYIRAKGVLQQDAKKVLS
jgi:2-methylisocitrate lyase-like PEP mutase family enzyme